MVRTAAPPITPTAERQGDGWLLTLPVDAIPSSNVTTREHWSARARRVDDLTLTLTLMLSQSHAPAPHVRPVRHRRRRLGAHLVTVDEPQRPCVLERAQMTLRVYRPTDRKRDAGNWSQGAGAKCCVDALVKAGWLWDDDDAHLRHGVATVGVDRERPRVEVLLQPWGDAS